MVNTVSALSVKELPEEELNDGGQTTTQENYGLIQAFKLLLKNKFYMMICGTYILQQLYNAMIGAGIYYFTWVLGNKNLFGVFAWAVNIPLIIALVFTPTLVGKWKGMYKLNLRGYILAVIGRVLVVVAGYLGNVPLMMLFTAVAALGQGPWQGGYERCDRILLGIYVSHTGQTGGWNHVFLYFPGSQDRRRYRNGCCRMASGDQRICREKSDSACIGDYHVTGDVFVGAICY